MSLILSNFCDVRVEPEKIVLAKFDQQLTLKF